MFKLIIGLISVAVLLIVCWMLTEYWLRSVRKFSKERISSLGIWNRVAFAFEDFCEAVNHKKDFRKMRVVDETSALHTREVPDERKRSEVSKNDGREKECMKKDKRYKIKENM